MTNLTKTEFQALQGIINSEFHDGSDPVDNPVWTFSANPFASARTFSGAMSSLVKKGLAHSYGEGRDAVVTITQAGFDAYNQAKAVAA